MPVPQSPNLGLPLPKPPMHSAFRTSHYGSQEGSMPLGLSCCVRQILKFRHWLHTACTNMTNMHTVLLFGCHCVINETSVTTQYTKSSKHRAARNIIDECRGCTARGTTGNAWTDWPEWRVQRAPSEGSDNPQVWALPIVPARFAVESCRRRRAWFIAAGARHAPPTPCSISAQCTAHLASTGETLPRSQIVRRHCCSHRVPSPLLFGISNTNHASPL